MPVIERNSMSENLEEGKKFLNYRYFIDIRDTTKRWIAPHSEIVAMEIVDVVKAICKAHGFDWGDENVPEEPVN